MFCNRNECDVDRDILRARFESCVLIGHNSSAGSGCASIVLFYCIIVLYCVNLALTPVSKPKLKDIFLA